MASERFAHSAWYFPACTRPHFPIATTEPKRVPSRKSHAKTCIHEDVGILLVAASGYEVDWWESVLRRVLHALSAGCVS